MQSVADVAPQFPEHLVPNHPCKNLRAPSKTTHILRVSSSQLHCVDSLLEPPTVSTYPPGTFGDIVHLRDTANAFGFKRLKLLTGDDVAQAHMMWPAY
eukprot:2626588-Amphidinium_carterae.3